MMQQLPQLGVMTVASIELLVAHLIRSPEVISAAQDKLTPEHFNKPYEEPYRLLWLLSQEFFIVNRKVIPRLHLAAAVNSRLESSPDLGVHIPKITEIIDWTYACAEDNFVPEAALVLLQQLIDERVVQPQFQQLGGATSDAIDQINKVYSTSRVASTSAINVFDLGDPSINESSKPVKPTGCAVFDILTDGGRRPSHMTGILAPTGGGKTLLITDLAVNAAKLQTHTAYFQYEQDVKLDIRPRIWSCATGIPSKTLSEVPFNKLAPAIQDILKAQSYIGSYLHMFDMRLPTTGNNGPAEIESILLNLAAKGTKPEVVLVDWLGVMVKRYLSAHNLPFEQHLHSTYNQFLSKLRDIANRFNIELVISHQLNADAGKKGPTSRPSVYDAQEFRSFSLLMDTCIIIGKATEDNLVLITNDKNRGPKDDCFARMRGDIGKFEIQNGQFSVVTDQFGRVNSVQFNGAGNTPALDGVS